MAQAHLDRIVLWKKDNPGVNVHPLGLRLPALLTIEDDVISIEHNKSVLNYTKLTIEAETLQCNYEMFKDFVNVFLVDRAVNAQVVTSSQQPNVDTRGLKGNEIINFGYGASGNEHAGFSFRYREFYSNGEKKTSAFIKLTLTIEQHIADAMLAAALVNTIDYADTKDKSKVNPGILESINHINFWTPLVNKADIQSYSLEIESVDDGEPTLYGRPQAESLRCSVTISTKDSGVEKYRDLNNASEFGLLYVTEKISATEKTLKAFNNNALSRTQKLSASDKRRLEIMYKGDVPILNTLFWTDIAGGITTKKVQFG